MVAVVPQSIDWSSSTCHANMGNCFGRTQIPSIELSEVFKRIRCLCTCCGGRVLIYKSELDGKQKSKNYFNPKHEASFGGLGKRATKKSGRMTLFACTK